MLYHILSKNHSEKTTYEIKFTADYPSNMLNFRSFSTKAVHSLQKTFKYALVISVIKYTPPTEVKKNISKVQDIFSVL